MNILDIFYNQIIKEASKGEVDAFFKYNLMFSTHIVEKELEVEAKSENKKRFFIPTLIIRNQEEFDRLLCEYVLLASKFYTDFDEFYEKIKVEGTFEEKELWRIKTLIVSLFSNATEEDFNNPCEFLKKRIDFINNSCEQIFDEFYSANLKAKINASIKKDKFNNEAPYMFCVEAVDELDIGYSFPNLKFGIHDGKAYVYAIQRGKEESNSRKINRNLYKVGEGFDPIIDNVDIYAEGNTKDVTASFLVVANLFLAYLSSIGINEVVVPSILIERWNAKEMSLLKRYRSKRFDMKEYLIRLKEHDELQSNLSEKLIRTFNRLTCHYPYFYIVSYPGEDNMSFCLNISDQKSCNNRLLSELREKFISVNDRKGLQI